MSIYENPYELIYMSRMGDEYAQTTLFLQYEGLLNALVNQTLLAYPTVRRYRDDILQEARISLFQAINQYQESKSASFKTFVCLVVKRKFWNKITGWQNRNITCNIKMRRIVYKKKSVFWTRKKGIFYLAGWRVKVIKRLQNDWAYLRNNTMVDCKG